MQFFIFYLLKIKTKGSKIVQKYIEHSNNVPPIMMSDKSECDD